VLALAASVLGAPYLSDFIAGQTGLSGSALSGATGATIGGGSTALTGGSTEDALKAALLAGGGAYLGSEVQNALYDSAAAADTAAGLSPTYGGPNPMYGTKYDAAMSDLLGSTEAQNALSDYVANAGTVSVTAPTTPSLSNVISAIGSTLPDAGTVKVDAPKSTQVDQNVINLINSQLASNVTKPSNVANVEVTSNKPATVQDVVNAITATLPTVTPTQAATIAEQVVTSNRPVTTQEVINAITAALPTVPAVTTPVVPEQTITAQKPSSIIDAVTAATIPLIQPSVPLEVTPVTAEKTTTIDPIRAAQLGLTAAGLLGAGSAMSGGGATQYPIVPVPESWKTPPRPSVAPATQLPPIDFGNRNLLIGTQWEKFLDPNYGKVPAPVQYSQPSNLSYNDLMGILGSKQGMPPASSLSINDIISGIQNQYGQAPARTMG